MAYDISHMSYVSCRFSFPRKIGKPLVCITLVSLNFVVTCAGTSKRWL